MKDLIYSGSFSFIPLLQLVYKESEVRTFCFGVKYLMNSSIKRE